MAAQNQPTAGLPELVQTLYDVLVSRGATIECEFENVEVLVPREPGPEAPQARWRVNGTLRIRTSEAGARGPG